MESGNDLKLTLEKQNNFILTFFNDKRISEEIKEEYTRQYNELKIKDSIDEI